MNTSAEITAKRYAKALWESSGPDQAPAVLKSFERFVEIYLSSEDLQKLFSNPAFSNDDKKKILTSIGEKASFSKEFQNFLGLLLEGGRISILGTILEAFRTKIMARDKIESVKIETALPISEAQQSKIISTLEKEFGSKFVSSVDIVPELLAGIKLHFLGRTIDSTLTGALFQMRQELLASES